MRVCYRLLFFFFREKLNLRLTGGWKWPITRIIAPIRRWGKFVRAMIRTATGCVSAIFGARAWRARLTLVAGAALLVKRDAGACADHFRGRAEHGAGDWIEYLFGATVDASGNIYIADASNNRVVKINPLGTQSVLSVTPLTLSSNPLAVVVDAKGRLYHRQREQPGGKSAGGRNGDVDGDGRRRAGWRWIRMGMCS